MMRAIGRASTDEMMIPYVSWTHVNPADDNEYRQKYGAQRKNALARGTE